MDDAAPATPGQADTATNDAAANRTTLAVPRMLGSLVCRYLNTRSPSTVE
jgi:hypothetical protein